MPGSSFPSTGRWEKENSEAVEVERTSSLFAENTTIIGNNEEVTTGLNKVKENMGRFEEKCNDSKEERLRFGEETMENIRMLGLCVGWKEDLKQRKRRAGAAWSKLKLQLKGTKISKQLQGQIVEACIESTMLFDCSVRHWYKKDIKQLQKPNLHK